MADKLCEGSLAPVLSHLFKAKGLTEQERRALRALIDDSETQVPPEGEMPDGGAAAAAGKPRGPKRTR